MMHILVIYCDVGDEDGPSLAYYLLDYEKYKDIVPKSHILNVNIDWKRWDLLYIGERYYPFLSIFNNYNIVDILEIYDWYDNLSTDDLITDNLITSNNMLNISPPIINKDFVLVTIVPYLQEIEKYAFPTNIDLSLFETNGNIEEKRQLARTISKYKIHDTYYNIVKSYSYITDHKVYLLDEIEDDEYVSL
jgi:hypothetical protein